MKRIFAIVLAFLMAMLCFACSNTENQNTKSNTSSVQKTSDIVEKTPTEGTEKEESAESAALRNKIKDADCTVGIAFVDYVENELSEEDTSTYFNHSETAAEYPFLKNIKTVAYEGRELFVLVPASRKATITVFPAEINADGELEVKKDTTVCKGSQGEPIALRCNISDDYANVLVSVSDGSEVCEFYPMISLEDGWTVAPQKGCYDFSIDDIRKYVDKTFNILPETYPEIQKSLDSGSTLNYAGDFYFCNQMMLRFELGKSDANTGEFVCEKQFAVSFDTTYEKTADGNWYVIGAGIKGMGLQKR